MCQIFKVVLKRLVLAVIYSLYRIILLLAFHNSREQPAFVCTLHSNLFHSVIYSIIIGPDQMSRSRCESTLTECKEYILRGDITDYHVNLWILTHVGRSFHGPHPYFYLLPRLYLSVWWHQACFVLFEILSVFLYSLLLEAQLTISCASTDVLYSHVTHMFRKTNVFMVVKAFQIEIN